MEACADAERRSQANTSCRLMHLPVELLDMIKGHLEPADAVCLGLASRKLFQTVDYHVLDVYNVICADLGKLVKLRKHLAVQCLEVTKRLDCDRGVALLYMEDHRMQQVIIMSQAVVVLVTQDGTLPG